MDFSALGAALGGLTGVGGLIVALNGRIEARSKAKMAPMNLTDKALEISGEWIDRMQRELHQQEIACEKKLAELRIEIDKLRSEVINLRRQLHSQYNVKEDS